MVGSENLSAADVAAVMGANGNNGGNWGGDGSFWIIVLFLFALMGGYGNGFGGNGGGFAPWMLGNMNTNNDVQRGFDQASVMNGINALTASTSNGFANAEVSRCNAQTNILQALNNNQMANIQSMNNIGMTLQQCCCNQAQNTESLRYTIATENAADRYEAANNTRDIIANQQNGIQTIMDKLCALELDGYKRENENLRTQLNMANLSASQTAQTAQIIANNEAQTAALESYLMPPVRPCYVVQNPNCCQQQWNGYGCGCGM